MTSSVSAQQKNTYENDPILHQIDEIFEINYCNQWTQDGLQKLNTILSNILLHPNEPKYKSLKKNNQKLQLNVFSLINILPLLKLLGFEEFEDRYEIRNPEQGYLEKIKKAQKILKIYLEDFEPDYDVPCIETYVREREKQLDQIQADLNSINQLKDGFKVSKKEDEKYQPNEVIENRKFLENKHQKKIEENEQQQEKNEKSYYTLFISLGFIGLIFFNEIIIIPQLVIKYLGF